MEHWYVLQTRERREQEAAVLLERSVSRTLWSECRILKKKKVFRSGGILHLLDDILFPGYLFIRTDCPGELAEELLKSRELPRLLQSGEWKSSKLYGRRQPNDSMIACVEEADLCFLKDVCGENLLHPMGVTSIVLDEESRIIHADGVLKGYLDRIVKLNLHKRFAVVEVPLFNRTQPILFGVRLEQDQAV